DHILHQGLLGRVGQYIKEAHRALLRRTEVEKGGGLRVEARGGGRDFPAAELHGEIAVAAGIGLEVGQTEAAVEHPAAGKVAPAPPSVMRSTRPCRNSIFGRAASWAWMNW